MWKKYIIVKDMAELLTCLSTEGSQKKIIAGGTDLMLELERGVRSDQLTLLDVTRIQGLDRIWQDEEGFVHIGALVTHNDILSSQLIRKNAYPLMQACWQIGSPQIRNVATVVGNLITASPANDTITPLMAMGASLTLKSKVSERQVALSDFCLGVRKTVMRDDEFCSEIVFKPLSEEMHGLYIKSALRKAQAISVVNTCILIRMKGDQIVDANITMGAVAPTIIHARSVETFLKNRKLDNQTIAEAAELVQGDIKPISDLRGSDRYRLYIMKVLIKRALVSISQGQDLTPVPERVVLLTDHLKETCNLAQDEEGQISATINNQPIKISNYSGKTLLRLLRDDLNLMGTKEGCAEGECGACTIHMNGKAVMSCLVPAPRAQGANITTIEGISDNGSIHPMQQSFIDEGAVQCGFCTPGFIMSGTMLMKEIQHPDENEIKQAITGNLCRCTGYYKIVKAIDNVSRKA